MPQNFLTCDRDQPLLLPPDLREWLPEDHLAWFVIEAIEELDLGPFYAAYRSDGHGRAGYWSNNHIDKLRERGITPLVAADAKRSKGPRKTRLGGPYDFMRRALATESGGDLYSRRQGMIEPVFADIKQDRRAGRFKRRGRAAVRSEWRLIAATHNLLKLHPHTLAAGAA